MQEAQMKTLGGQSIWTASMGALVGRCCGRHPGRTPAWPPDICLRARPRSPQLSSDSVLPSTSLPVCLPYNGGEGQ